MKGSNVNEDGTSTVKFKACDRLGNCSAETSYIAKIDRVKPATLTISNPYANKWTANDVKLTLGSTDAHSGIGEYYYSYNANATAYSNNSSDEETKWVKLSTGTDKASFTTPGTIWNKTMNRTVYIQSCDKVGNCSEVKSTVVKIDKKAPNVFTLRNSNTSWTKSNVTLSITGGDQHSGMGEYYYRIGSSGSWTKFSGGTNKTSFTSTWSAERNSTVYVKACDKVGNCTSPDHTTIKIDKSKPTCSVSYSNENTTSGVTMKATCNDHGGSGCTTGTSTITKKNVKEGIDVLDFLLT